jgi:2-polyprenyl-6-methoxyphenol hydroxylase-like FAD-dependent oxidoreductase
MIPQSETERILGDFLNSLGITIERSIELLDFTASESGVASTLRHADGTEETVDSSWLIGCDGAHSTIRHKLGMEFHGETSPINWIIADIHLKDIPRAPEINILWHPEGVLVTFPIADDRYRIIADAGTADTDAATSTPTLEQVQDILDKRYPGKPKATDPIWLSGFRINERKVKDYRSGRVFLAGDAAHVHSPAGGQGMNTGMHDACNLAWKLAMVVRGTASESLLDTYSPERSPIADEVLKLTGKATEIATLQGDFAQSIRNHIAPIVLGFSSVRNLAAGALSELSLAYTHSPLNDARASASPSPGHRAPIRSDEALVGSGSAPRFVLAADPDGMPADFSERYASLLDPTPHKPYQQGKLWLVRPDGYTALTANAGDWNAVANYLDRI